MLTKGVDRTRSKTHCAARLPARISAVTRAILAPEETAPAVAVRAIPTTHTVTASSTSVKPAPRFLVIRIVLGVIGFRCMGSRFRDTLSGGFHRAPPNGF